MRSRGREALAGIHGRATTVGTLAHDRRRALLTAALGFTAIHWHAPFPPAAVALATWLDSWRGVGAVVGGMRRLGYEVEMKVEMKQFPNAW